MLRALHVSGLALLAAVDAEFAPGLNVITGETGAGKSLVVDALALALGGRAATEMLRAGSTRAVVDAAFDGVEGIPGTEEGALVLTREFAADGRSVCRINGRPCTVATLRQTGEHLADIHGQGGQARLLRPAEQLAFLDAFGGDATLSLRRDREQLLQELAACERRLGTLAQEPQQQDFLEYQLHELQAAAVGPTEALDLAARRTVLQHAERLFAGVTEVYDALRALPALAARLGPLASVDPRLGAAVDLCREAEVAASEAAELLRRYREDLRFEPGELERVETRLADLGRLRRKYGEDLAAARTRLVAALAATETGRCERERLATRRGQVLEALGATRARLLAARREAAAALSRRLDAELAQVGMPGAALGVDIEAEGGRGEFLLAANPGEPALPLQRCASGGELARVLLALEVALAAHEAATQVAAGLASAAAVVGATESDALDAINPEGADQTEAVGPSGGPATLVFDEIDAGIGGLAARAVATRLARLSATRQVLCVTHLATIAAAADAHFLLTKETDAGRTQTRLRRIEGPERRLEIARMLAGLTGTAALRHADELLARGAEQAR